MEVTIRVLVATGRVLRKGLELLSAGWLVTSSPQELRGRGSGIRMPKCKPVQTRVIGLVWNIAEISTAAPLRGAWEAFPQMAVIDGTPREWVEQVQTALEAQRGERGRTLLLARGPQGWR